MARALSFDEWKRALWQAAFNRLIALPPDASLALCEKFNALRTAPTPAAVKDLTLQLRDELAHV